MATLLLPFHADERISEGSIVVPAEAAGAVVDPRLPGADRWQRLATLYDTLAGEVAQTVATGEPVTVLSGDCLALLGTLAGLQRAGLDPSVVWFDAHGDLHTMASSTSGYLGGMALRMALGGDSTLLAGPLGVRPLPESAAVLVDARDLDPAELEYLATSGVARAQVDTISADDMPDGPVILHVDLDVIDPSELPGLRFPAPGGPTSGSVLAALTRLLHSGNVAALDVACTWHDPTDDQQGQRRQAILTRITNLPNAHWG